MDIEMLKELYYKDDVRSLEEFTKFAERFMSNENVKLAYDYYINKCWNSASQYFK